MVGSQFAAERLDAHLDRLAASRARCLASQVLVGQSRERLATSRRLVGRRRLICGASETDLRETIHLRLASGTLPILDGRAWAGAATGQTCLVCGRAIDAPDIEYEIQDPYHAYAHLVCFTIWLDESKAARQARMRPCVPRPPAEMEWRRAVDGSAAG